MPTQKTQPSRKAPANAPPETIDPKWLLRALGITVGFALVCGYLTIGLLFYLSSWQLVLHPTRLANSGTSLPSEKIRFAPNGAGVSQLAGEWLPAEAGNPRADYAVLYLRGADGQLDPADGSQISTLHSLGLNVLAFDYRGYGSSAERPHPSMDRMVEDAVSAWNYLTNTRKIAPAHVIVFANGIGASVAGQMLQNYGPGGALIVYNADPDVMTRVHNDARIHLFPLSVVFHDSFPIDDLNKLTTPKLLFSVGPQNPTRIAAYRQVSDPKMTVELPTHNAEQEKAALARFMDSYLK